MTAKQLSWYNINIVAGFQLLSHLESDHLFTFNFATKFHQYFTTLTSYPLQKLYQTPVHNVADDHSFLLHMLNIHFFDFNYALQMFMVEILATLIMLTIYKSVLSCQLRCIKPKPHMKVIFFGQSLTGSLLQFFK